MGITISGGSVTISGAGRFSGPTEEKTVGGVSIKFEAGENLRQRQVQVAGGMSLTIGPGLSATMPINNVSVRSDNGRLWVNGQEVSFASDPGAAAAQREAAERGQAALQARFPGVLFSGVPSADAIAPDVRIEAGARIDLTNTQLSGSVIGASAEIGPSSTIVGSRVDGRVENTVLRNSLVMKGASVNVAGNAFADSVAFAGSKAHNNGKIENSVLMENATAAANGSVRDSILGTGSRLASNGSMTGSILGAGASFVSNGSLRDSEVPPAAAIAENRSYQDRGSPITATAGFRALAHAQEVNPAISALLPGVTSALDRSAGEARQTERLGAGPVGGHLSNAGFKGLGGLVIEE
jgi:hypothetical protein